LDFYYRSLYLNGKIDFDFFGKKIVEVNAINIPYANSLIRSYEKILDETDSIEQMFIKDEIIQLASILKNSNSQFFGNIPILKSGMYQSGKNSLLGIGQSVLGILSIYLHLRNCFNKFNFEDLFENKYTTIPSPNFLLKPDTESYPIWYRTFIDTNGLDHYLDEKDNNSTYFLVYFSNRQGFRLTKHAVSAAMQSLYLSYLPSFTLNTLSHELLHAHVRSEIMVEFYPLLKNKKGLHLNNRTYDKYKNVFKTNHENYSISDFIQINFLFMAGLLNRNGNNNVNKKGNKKTYPKAELYKSLKKWEKEIEEIIVHILDLNYFYNSKGNFYVRAIWTSWLSLPFSINNLSDYILRTVCAISSLDDTSERVKRFDYALEMLKNELNEIKSLKLVNNKYVNIVLSSLEDSTLLDNIRYNYMNGLVNLVDISKKFFFSSSLKSTLNYDTELIESDNGDYTYDLNIGVFEKRKITSPISLINEINNYNLTHIKELNGLSQDEIERRSTWLNALLNTSLNFNSND